MPLLSTLPTLFASLNAPSKPPGFLQGFLLPFRCVPLCWTHKALRRQSLITALLTAALLLGCALGAWFLSSYVINLLWNVDAAATWKSIAHFGLRLLGWAVLFALGCIGLPPLLLASLQDEMSETAERELRPNKPQNARHTSAWSRLYQSLLRVLLFYGGTFFLFACSFLPFIGFLFGLLGILWATAWLSLEYISSPLARDEGSFFAGLHLLKKRKPLFLGFGFGVYVLLWVPFIQFFLIPGATVAGTLLYFSVQDEFPAP